LRLARFNVLSRMDKEHKPPGKYTRGLPIPPASSVLVLMVIASYNAGQYKAVSESSILALVLVLSFLMVSRVRFRSFKDIRWTPRTIGILILLVGAITATLLAGIQEGLIFLVLVSAYIALGLMEEIVSFRLKRRRKEVGPAADVPEDSEEDVLRELGAFDENEVERKATPSDHA
jgi:CDP-diacylglycerol--serine O-phosphatidyltransferase